MDKSSPMLIGDLARQTGQSVRTIRFWSDEGIVPPTGRTPAGHRTYDAQSLAQVQLVVTMRRLGLDLDTVRAVLETPSSIAGIASVHARALDAEIKSLRLRRAVLLAIAQRGLDLKETAEMNDLALLTAAERSRLVDEFIADTFGEQRDPSGIGERMREATHALPDDPTPEQVDAWVEVAGLVQDPSFRRRVRRMARAGGEADGSFGGQGGQEVAARVAELAGPAAARGVDPASEEARSIVDRLLPEGRSWDEAAETIKTFTDERVNRYWELVGVINGWPPFPSPYPAFAWLLKALEAHPGRG